MGTPKGTSPDGGVTGTPRFGTNDGLTRPDGIMFCDGATVDCSIGKLGAKEFADTGATAPLTPESPFVPINELIVVGSVDDAAAVRGGTGSTSSTVPSVSTSSRDVTGNVPVPSSD